jgi:HAD superfamily hydrolase (TIGR01509 family)
MPKFSNHAAIIFDMDETLTATTLLWRVAEEKLFAAIGQPWTPELANKYKGMNLLGVAETIHRELKPDLSVEACQKIMREALFEAYENAPVAPMPGAVECVRRLAAKYPLAVASGSPQPLIEYAIGQLGLRDCFAVLISSESVPRGKPAPDIFLAAAKALNVEPSHCLVFEDSLIGTQAALAAGMACFAVPSASHKEIALIATRHFSSLHEVMLEDVVRALEPRQRG